MKEKKPSVTPKRDSNIEFDYQEFYQNSLSLPQALKDKLKEEGLDYRFLNRTEFLKNGNTHRSHWKAYTLKGSADEVGLLGLTVDGHIQRGDLILGVRPKAMTAGHKKYLAHRAAQYSGYNKKKAQEIREMAKEHGVADQTQVFEGYEDNE